MEFICKKQCCGLCYSQKTFFHVKSHNKKGFHEKNYSGIYLPQIHILFNSAPISSYFDYKEIEKYLTQSN